MQSKLMDIVWKVDFRYLNNDEEQAVRDYAGSIDALVSAVEELQKAETEIVRAVVARIAAEDAELLRLLPEGRESVAEEAALLLRACATALLLGNERFLDEEALHGLAGVADRLEIPSRSLSRLCAALRDGVSLQLGRKSSKLVGGLLERGERYFAERSPLELAQAV